jgi:hypothetical protein
MRGDDIHESCRKKERILPRTPDGSETIRSRRRLAWNGSRMKIAAAGDGARIARGRPWFKIPA